MQINSRGYRETMEKKLETTTWGLGAKGLKLRDILGMHKVIYGLKKDEMETTI